MGAGQSRQAPLRSCVLLPGRSTIAIDDTPSCAQRYGSIYVEPFKRSTHYRPSWDQCARLFVSLARCLV